MDKAYEIKFDASPVGTAQMEKQGLYYRFSCRCRLPDEGIYRIHVCCGDKHEDLGICIPLDGAFGMDKRIPVKHLGEGEMSFQLLPKDWMPQELAPVQEPEPALYEDENPMEAETVLPDPEEKSFVPVSEEEPFEYLDKLENAVMEVRNEQVGIVFPKEE